MGGVDLRWEFGGSGEGAKTCYHRDWSLSFRVYVVTFRFRMYVDSYKVCRDVYYPPEVIRGEYWGKSVPVAILPSCQRVQNNVFQFHKDNGGYGSKTKETHQGRFSGHNV